MRKWLSLLSAPGRDAAGEMDAGVRRCHLLSLSPLGLPWQGGWGGRSWGGHGAVSGQALLLGEHAAV